MGHLKQKGFLALIDEASLEGAGELDDGLKNEAGKLPIAYLTASWNASGDLVERCRKKAEDFGQKGRLAEALFIGFRDPWLMRRLEDLGLRCSVMEPRDGQDVLSLAARITGAAPSFKKREEKEPPADTPQETPACLASRLFSTGRKDAARSDEPSMLLRLARGRPSPALMDRAAAPLVLTLTTDTKEKPEKALETARLTGLMLTASGKSRDRARMAYDLFAKEADGLGLRARLAFAGKKREARAVFTISLPPGADEPDRAQRDFLDDAAGALLNALLLGARPAPRWRSGFSAAFLDEDGAFYERCRERCEKGHLAILRPPAKVSYSSEKASYFLPEMQRLIMPEAAGGAPPPAHADAFWSFVMRPGGEQRPGGRLSLRVRIGNYQEPLEAAVKEVRAHFNPGGTFWLEWLVEDGCEEEPPQFADGEKPGPDPCMSGAASPLWRHYLRRASEDEDAWPLAKVLDFNAEARMLLYDYLRNSRDEDSTIHFTSMELLRDGEPLARLAFEPQNASAASPGQFEVSGFVRALLVEISGDEGYRKTPPIQLSDNRARVITSVILDGSPPPADAPGAEIFDALSARLSSVDPYGTGWSYDPPFARKELEEAAYKRFWNLGSRFMITDHSFAFIGFRWHPSLPGPREPGRDKPRPQPRPEYAENPIHAIHMAWPYARMFRYFLAIESSLRGIARQLAGLERALPSRRLPPPGHVWERLLDLRHDLNRLSGQLINAHVSSQIQGRELAEKMRAQFGHAQTWSELDERLRRAEDMWRSVRRTRREFHLRALYFTGVLLATLLTLNGLKPQAAYNPFAFLWQRVMDLSCLPPLVWLPGAGPQAAALILTALSGYLAVVLGADVLACVKAGGGWKRLRAWRHCLRLGWLKSLLAAAGALIIAALLLAPWF